MRGALILLTLCGLLAAIFAQVDVCGDGICGATENCFRDCAGSTNRFKCAFTHLLPLPSWVSVNGGNGTLGNSVLNGGSWAVPGSEHVNRGFDIVSGEETAHPVIALQYCDDNPDHSSYFSNFQAGSLFVIPQEVHIVPRPECSYSASTSTYAYAYNFAQSKASASSMSVSASASVSVGSIASASASASYSKDSSVKQAVEMTQNNDRSLAVTESKCLVSEFDWKQPLDRSFGLNHLHPDFETALNNMRNSIDAKNVVAKYGTHFYAKGHLGGKMEQITAVDSSLVSQKSSSAVSESISKSFSASVGGGVGSFSGSVSASGSDSESAEEERSLSKSIAQSSSSTEVRTYGGIPFSPSSDSWSSWANSISALPVVLDYSLTQILDILPDVTNRFNFSVRQLWSEGVYQYLLENQFSYGNSYEMFTFTQCNATLDDNAYGPYAFKIDAVEDSPAIMQAYELFRGLSDGNPHYFASNMVSRFGISIYKNILSPIQQLEFVSLAKYIEAASNATKLSNDYLNGERQFADSTADYNNRVTAFNKMLCQLLGLCGNTGLYTLPDQIAVNEVKAFPLMYASLLNVAQGTETLYYPSSATNSVMRLFAKARTFYEVTITAEAFDSTLYSQVCSPSSFDSGIVQIGLYGSKDNLVHQQSLDDCYKLDVGSVYNTFRIYTQKDLGSLTAVIVKGLYTTNDFCLLIQTVKVVGLDDVVYSYTFPSANQFQLSAISGGAINAKGARAANRNNIKQGQTKSKATFVAPLTAIAANNGPLLFYLYQLAPVPHNNTVLDAAYLCNRAGGVLASPYYLQKGVDNGADWCRPGLGANSASANSCFLLRSTASATCGSGARGVVATTSHQCGAICLGTLPSAALLRDIDANITESVVALEVSYASIASLDSTINLNPQPVVRPPPTPAPPSPSPCNVTLSYTPTNVWVQNGQTIRQYDITFRNAGTLIATAVVINMPTASVSQAFNMPQTATNKYSVSLPNGIQVGQTISGQHGVQAYGNDFIIKIDSVACN